MCHYPFTYKRTIVESLMCGRMFVVAGKRGYDTEHFCKVVMTSDYGIRVMTGDNHREWADEYFLLSGFEEYVGLIQGETYLSYVLSYMGYLYKYWIDKHGMNPVDVYNMARPSEINDKYLSLYTEGYDYAIEVFSNR